MVALPENEQHSANTIPQASINLKGSNVTQNVKAYNAEPSTSASHHKEVLTAMARAITVA